MLTFGIHHDGAGAVTLPAGTAASSGNPLIFLGIGVALVIVIYLLYWASKKLFKN